MRLSGKNATAVGEGTVVTNEFVKFVGNVCADSAEQHSNASDAETTGKRRVRNFIRQNNESLVVAMICDSYDIGIGR
ncbi:MAG: hypothetical protein ACRCWJ_19690, partial [Casimicrobium sp.]